MEELYSHLPSDISVALRRASRLSVASGGTEYAPIVYLITCGLDWVRNCYSEAVDNPPKTYAEAAEFIADSYLP